MKPAPFSYIRPENIEQVCEVLAHYGEDARILAGGQSLGAMLNMRLVTPAVIVDINRIQGLDSVAGENGHVITGALVRQADALNNVDLAARVPLLARALPHVGHFQTRSRGTLGGSVAHADPSAEIPLALFVIDGEVDLQSRKRTRRVRARDFFKSALVTARAPDEAVVALRWPTAAAPSHYGFRELAMRAGDYAVVAGACAVRFSSSGALEDVSLGFAGCSDRPQLVPTQAAAGQKLTPELIREIAELAASRIECKADLHATAAYRRQLVRIFAEELLGEALVAARKEV